MRCNMCNALEVDNPLTKKNEEGKNARSFSQRSRKQENYIRAYSVALEATGAAPCTENFFSLLHLFSALWHANVLALQCSTLPDHCNNYGQCQMLKKLLEILLNKVL